MDFTTTFDPTHRDYIREVYLDIFDGGYAIEDLGHSDAYEDVLEHCACSFEEWFFDNLPECEGETAPTRFESDYVELLAADFATSHVGVIEAEEDWEETKRSPMGPR